MLKLPRALRLYRNLSPSFYRVFTAQLLLTFVQTAFLLIFNLLLKKNGYTDLQIGTYTSVQYLGVLLLAFPLGFILRGRRIRPFFLVSGLLTPLISLAVLECVVHRWDGLLYVALFLWGMGFVSFQIGVLPWLLRNTSSHVRTEAIAFLYTNFSMSQLLAGAAIWGLTVGMEWDEYRVLQVISLLGLLSPMLCFSIRENAPEQEAFTLRNAKALFFKGYDWPRIGRVLLPNTFLTIGAGLTMPFMNLFFYVTYGIDSDDYSLLSIATAIAVVIGTLYIARIRRQFGYRIAITLSQVPAVALLAGMALVSLEPEWAFAMPLALAFFLLRQPLMHSAVPMTRELMLLHAGERNREMVSSLVSSIRSGTYVFSAQLFGLMRGNGAGFPLILLTTAVLYGLGVIMYYRLIVSYERGSSE